MSPPRRRKGTSRTMNWGGLPPELLHLISTQIPSISDLIHFRGVCKAWRASAFSALPPQTPCFLLRPDPGATTLQFYSLVSGGTHTVTIPSFHDQTVLGSSNGYLLLQHLANSDLTLLNPVTDSKVSLPYLQMRRPRLVWASPDLVQTNDFSVCISGNSWTPNKFSAFWRQGEAKWIGITNGSQRSCFHEGLYYVLSAISKSLAVYDVATATLHDAVLPPLGEGPFSPPAALSYIVVSAGQILRVLEHDDKHRPVHQCRFEIHKLETRADKEKPFWVNVSSIGDQILFLNVVNGFSISASCFDGFRGNLIYFMKEEDTGDDYQSHYVLAKYDIEAGTAELLPFPPVKGGTWFQPSHRCA